MEEKKKEEKEDNKEQKQRRKRRGNCYEDEAMRILISKVNRLIYGPK